MQIGKVGPQTGNADLTRLGQPAGVEVDTAANEVYVADGYFNRRVIVFDSETGEIQSTLGRPGRYAGEFHWVHDMAIDAQGRLYAGEVDTGQRVQKFVRQR
jgi:DNA-binding beta-propeller fold protein YncE